MRHDLMMRQSHIMLFIGKCSLLTYYGVCGVSLHCAHMVYIPRYSCVQSKYHKLTDGQKTLGQIVLFQHWTSCFLGL